MKIFQEQVKCSFFGRLVTSCGK